MEECCSVCRLDEAQEDDLIIYCDGCDIGVHQGCYGVTTVPAGDWYCNRCKEGNVTARCSLCPSGVGAMKPTTCGNWAHVVCSLYCTNVQFVDEQTMEPIALPVLDMPASMACYICMEAKNGKSRVGQTIMCNYPGCTRAFHVTCGQSLDLLREESSEASFYNGYCKSHIGQRRVVKESSDSGSQRKKRKRSDGAESENRVQPPPAQHSSGRKRGLIDGDDAIFALASDLPTMKPPRRVLSSDDDEEDEAYDANEGDSDSDERDGHHQVKRSKLVINQAASWRKSEEEGEKRATKKQSKGLADSGGSSSTQSDAGDRSKGSAMASAGKNVPRALIGGATAAKKQQLDSEHASGTPLPDGTEHGAGRPMSGSIQSVAGNYKKHRPNDQKKISSNAGNERRKQADLEVHKSATMLDSDAKPSRLSSSTAGSQPRVAGTQSDKKRSHKKQAGGSLGSGGKAKEDHSDLYSLMRMYAGKEKHASTTIDDSATLESFLMDQHSATDAFARDLYQQALLDEMVKRADAIDAIHQSIVDLEESYDKLKAKSEKIEATIKKQTAKKSKYQAQREEAGAGSKELIFKIKVTAFHVLGSCATLARQGTELDLRSFHDYWKVALQVCEGSDKEKKTKRAKAMRLLGEQLVRAVDTGSPGQ